jgi:hypothetical protein
MNSINIEALLYVIFSTLLSLESFLKRIFFFLLEGRLIIQLHFTHNIYSHLCNLKILFILNLTRHVSAAVGHHQVFLIKLFHCNINI